MMSTSGFNEEGREDEDTSQVNEDGPGNNEDGTRSRRYKQVRQ
jgi:hypothetical protein